MTAERTKVRMAKITPVMLPCVEIKVLMGYGQYYRSNWMRGMGANGMTFVKR